MAYANAIKYNQVRAMKGLPVGAIVPWSAEQSAIPIGWIICNGSTIANTKYPLLYECIGNTYGGTAGSTFKLPPLTNNGSAMVDQYTGHFNYLTEDHNKPDYTTKSSDPYWSIVDGSTDGNTGSSSQDTWISTIDVVGEYVGSPKFYATYDDMTVSEGEFSHTVVWAETSLYDYHLLEHNHSEAATGESTSWKKGSGYAIYCTGSFSDGTACTISCTKTSVTRVAKPGHTGIFKGNNQSDLQKTFTATITSSGGTSYVGGGGGGQVYSLPGFGSGGLGESSAQVYGGGDGKCGGSMQCGSNILFTSLSNTEKSIGDVGPHSHGTTTYNMKGKYLVVSPGLKDDISLNNVTIDNSPGQNFCTITATTSTPSLEMVYIIRAF